METLTKRLFRVSSVTWFVLIITSWNVFRAAVFVLRWRTLAPFTLNLPIITAAAFFWTFFGVFVLWVRWTGRLKPLASLAVQALAGLFYFAWFWVDKLFLQASPANNHLFEWFFTGILLLIYLLLVVGPTLFAIIFRSIHEQ